MISSDARRLDHRRARSTQPPQLTRSLSWSDSVRRSKLRRPEPPARVLHRPRLLTCIDESRCPLTLIVAPAGFGKTTVAAEWAGIGAPAAWLTADAADASLARFWAHLQAAIESTAPGLGELVTASLNIPHRAPAAELGRILADELLDHGDPVRIVIDDAHQIPAGEVHDFLTGLLELAPPFLQLLLTARVEPPLSLARFRLRGQVNDIGSPDLLFDQDEIRAFLANAAADTGNLVTAEEAEIVHRQTGGWAAGLRLIGLRRAADQKKVRRAISRHSLDHRLLGPLLDETLASFAPQVRRALLRAALPESFTATLVHELDGREMPYGVVQDTLLFARTSGICRTSARLAGDWLEFHPLFRDLLMQQLARVEAPETVVALHSRASEWFEANAMFDAAISHRLAAGNLIAAVALVERQVQPALAQEDWPDVARWLALLPQDVVTENPLLLLAKGWVLHFRGLSQQLVDVLGRISQRLDRGDLPPTEEALLRTEAPLMAYGSLLPFQIDGEEALAVLQGTASQLTPAQVFAAGMAHAGVGIALHVNGRSGEAVAYLETLLARAPAPIDAAAIRLTIGLLWIHSQASHLGEIAAVAQTMHQLAGRHRLRLSAGWARRFLGDASYEQNDLDGAIAHYTAIVHDHHYFHLAGVREALAGLALAYRAQGRLDEAWRALQRVREIMLAAGALEHLSLLEAYSAYLALCLGDVDRALAWARTHAPAVDTAPLFLSLHPAFVRAAILVAAGDETEIASAVGSLGELRERSERGNFGAALIRINALLAVTHMKQGETLLAADAMRRSLVTGIARGYVRTYLDLLPMFGPELRALATRVSFPLAVHAALTDSAAADGPASAPSSAMGTLTEREGEVLAALFQRLTYKEIAASLYISPATVKRHASSIYSKLGVSGRREAIRVAREQGWQA